MTEPPTLWLACNVLRAEIEALRRQGSLGGTSSFLDSMLHMAPQKLEAVLEQALEQPDRQGRLVLVYGDCCARMLELVRRFQARRVEAINCAQMLLGRARYRELMREQAFLLLPEWAARWREVMRVELGLSDKVARDFMRDHRRVLVYLDTGLTAVPRQDLEECSAYTGLPWRVETVGLDYLLSYLLEAEKAASSRTPQEPRP